MLRPESDAPAFAAGRCLPDQWLIDTGSGHDLIGRSSVPSKHLQSARPAPEQNTLNTANGPTRVTQVVDVTIGALATEASPLLLADSPPVISVGRRCTHEGYGFHWEPGEAPTLVTPDGVAIRLVA